MRNRVYNKPPRFTTKRGNVYYINFRLPDGTFFRRSLGTDSLQAVEVTMSRLSASAAEPESDDTPLLSAAWKLFTTEKGKAWAAAVANENQRFYGVLLYVIGDLPVGAITKQHIRQTSVKSTFERMRKQDAGTSS